MNESKEHILTSSLQLFLQKGFKDVTMKDIVEKTGLSKGAFYHYFSSKEQVFEEVIRFFFNDFFVEDFNEYSHNSLEQFIHDAVESLDRKLKSAKIVLQDKDHAFNANHYFLLFDALKLLPDFKQELLKRQKSELKAWTKIVTIARKNREIRSDMTDEQVAKLFIFVSDGVGINLIMLEEMQKAKKELQTMWGGLYTSLKK